MDHLLKTLFFFNALTIEYNISQGRISADRKREAVCIGGLALQQQATKAVGRKYTKNFLS